MTGHPIVRYQCDRCGATEDVPVENKPPQERIAGPSDWLLLRIGGDLTIPPAHLCGECYKAFTVFMHPPRKIDML